MKLSLWRYADFRKLATCIYVEIYAIYSPLQDHGDLLWP